MRMNVRRAGVAVLVSALVTTLMSTTQAGVIPWLYDAIFGPAYPHPYAGYGAGWGYSCAPAPCGPCQVGYAPRAVTPCATGVCATAAYYGPVRSTCPTTVACRGNGDAEVGKLAPEPDSLPPAPRTFDDAPVPDPATRDLEHSQPKVSGVAAPDTANDSTDAGFGTGTRGEAAEGEFAPPVVRP